MGHDPSRGSDPEVFKISRSESGRVGSGRVRRCSKSHGSGQEVSYLTGRVGSGRVTLTRPDPRELIRPVKCPAKCFELVWNVFRSPYSPNEWVAPESKSLGRHKYFGQEALLPYRSTGP